MLPQECNHSSLRERKLEEDEMGEEEILCVCVCASNAFRDQTGARQGSKKSWHQYLLELALKPDAEA